MIVPVPVSLFLTVVAVSVNVSSISDSLSSIVDTFTVIFLTPAGTYISPSELITKVFITPAAFTYVALNELIKSTPIIALPLVSANFTFIGITKSASKLTLNSATFPSTTETSSTITFGKSSIGSLSKIRNVACASPNTAFVGFDKLINAISGSGKFSSNKSSIILIFICFDVSPGKKVIVPVPPT